MEFSVNMGPRHGTVTVDPTHGNELTTIFTFSANDWVDPEDIDYPLLYGYTYLDGGQNQAVLQAPLDDNQLETVLPYVNQGVVDVTMTCSDSLGTSTTAQKSIGLSLLKDQERAQAIQAEIEELEIADIDEIPGYISKLTSSTELLTTDTITSLVSAFDRYFDDIVEFDENNLDTTIASHKLIT